jgi:hypothetical protein
MAEMWVKIELEDEFPEDRAARVLRSLAYQVSRLPSLSDGVEVPAKDNGQEIGFCGIYKENHYLERVTR